MKFCSRQHLYSHSYNTLNKALNDSASNINSSIFIGSVIVDNTLPTLSSISSSVSSSSATITWATNEDANSNVSYGTTILMISNTGSATYESSHSISLSSLSASTLYYFNVSSCDAGRNCNTSTQYNFTTSVATEEVMEDSGSGGGEAVADPQQNIMNVQRNGMNGLHVAMLNKKNLFRKNNNNLSKRVIESKFNATETRACAASALTPLSNTNTETGKTNIAPIEVN